eukprot:940781-Rhodomonas_salina.3
MASVLGSTHEHVPAPPLHTGCPISPKKSHVHAPVHVPCTGSSDPSPHRPPHGIPRSSARHQSGTSASWQKDCDSTPSQNGTWHLNVSGTPSRSWDSASAVEYCVTCWRCFPGTSPSSNLQRNAGPSAPCSYITAPAK